MSTKQTIIIDFDGVLHSYTSGWKGADQIPDQPTPGAMEAMHHLRKTYTVVVVSSRCHQEGGLDAIKAWLKLHNIEVDEVTDKKPPHIVVVDDRALRFNGDWDASVQWNKKTNQP